MTASQSLSLDAFCAVADNLFELLNRSSVNNVESHPHNKARSDRMQNNISNQGHANHSSNLSNACLPFHPDQKPKICRAHIFYAERARTCKHWCRWPGTKPRIVDSRESSRTNSRENSPVRSNQGNWQLPSTQHPMMSSTQRVQTILYSTSIAKLIISSIVSLLIQVQLSRSFLEN